jgi:RNA polymerase sigma factor (sigma-70 family)
MNGHATSRRESHRPDGIGYLLSGPGSRSLTAVLQNQLAASYHRTKDPRLERKLVEANLRLVVKIACDSDRSRRKHLEDLIQEGCVGLVEAVHRFDPAKGAHFATYAGFWIRAFVMRYIMDNVRVVRVVRTRAQRVAFFHGEVAASEVSLDASITPTDRPLHEILAEPTSSPLELVEAAELAEKVREEVAALEARVRGREATILRERLLAAEPKPLREVGRRLSISGERVRQIEVTLLAALQAGFGVGSAFRAAAA